MSMQTNAESRAALAETLLPEGAARIISAILLVIAGTLFIAISAKIKVPFFPVPMTLQTLAVPLVAAAYGSRLGVITILAYLGEGLIGMPVFTNTPPAVAGAAYFLGPTGGYLIGYIAAAWIVGAAADRSWDRSFPKLFGAMLLGDIVVFVLGFAWLAWGAQLSTGSTGLGVAAAFSGGVAPFLLGDLLKLVLAAAAVPAVWQLVERRGS